MKVTFVGKVTFKSGGVVYSPGVGYDIPEKLLNKFAGLFEKVIVKETPKPKAKPKAKIKSELDV